MAKCILEYSSVNCKAYFGRQEFFILMHYAHLLQPMMAEKMYYAGETEYIYRTDKKLPLNGLEYDGDGQYPYWDKETLTEVIAFIKDDLVSSLSQESSDDIIDILGGYNILQIKIDEGADFKKRFGIIYPEEEIFSDVNNYIVYANALAEVIEDAITHNAPYLINYGGNC